MDTPSPAPVRPPVFFALLIALLSLGAIWFTAGFFLPKAQLWLTDYPPTSPVPLGGAALIHAWRPIFHAAPAGLLLAVLLAGAALLPKLSTNVRRLNAWALHGLALLFFGGILYIAAATFMALMWSQMSADTKLRSYRRELEIFGLAESAEGRFDRINQMFQRFASREPRIARHEEELKRLERQSRLTAIAELLNKTADPRMRRRMLATLPFFRKTLEKTSLRDRVFLQHAQELSGQTFADMAALLAWLPTAPKEDGWEPLPIYIFD